MSTCEQRKEVPRVEWESFLEKSAPLGFPRDTRPERGPGVARYYGEKHRRGEFGAYWPLHQVEHWSKS